MTESWSSGVGMGDRMAVCDMEFGRAVMLHRFVDMRRSTSPVVEKYRTVASAPDSPHHPDAHLKLGLLNHALV